MANEVGRIDLGLSINQTMFNNQLRNLAGNAERATSSIFAGLGSKIGAVLGIAAITKFTKSCIKLGSDLEEVQNVVDTTFRKLSGSANAFAQTAIDKFGLSETVAKKYIGTFGTMGKAMGLSEQSAYDMAEAITGLTGDVASFYNLSGDAAYAKLKSIWTGETEALKDLGVVMTQTNLDQYALNNGFGKTTKNMTEQEKVMLRYQYVMSSLSDAQGDFQRTSDGWANQTRVLSLRFEQLKATLGQGFINALTPVVKMLNTIVASLQNAANAFSDFTAIVFGKQKTSSGTTTSAELDSITGSANEASKAIASANKQLAGFDKLNVISSTKGGTIGGSAIQMPELENTNGGATEEEINNTPMVKWFEKVKESIKPTKEALEGLYTKGIKPLTEFTATALFDFYDKFLKPVGTWVLGEGLPSLVTSCKNLLSYIDWDKLNGALRNLFDALAPFAKSIGNGLITFIEDLSKFAGKSIGSIISSIASGTSALADAIKSIDSNILDAVGSGLGTFLGVLGLGFGLRGIGKILISLGGALGGFFGSISKYKALFTVAAGVGIAAFIGSIFDSVSAIDREEMNKAIDELEDAMDGLGNVLDKAKDNYDKAKNKNNKISITVDAYFKLANKGNLTGEEKELLKAYAKQLTDEMPELNKLIDEHTGMYTGTEKEIRKMIQAHQDYVMQVASEKAAEEVTASLLDATLAYEKASQEYDDARQRLADADAAVPQWIKDQRYDNLIAGGVYNALTGAVQEDVRKAGTAVYDAKKLMEQAEKDRDWYLQKAAEFAEEYALSMQNTTEDLADSAVKETKKTRNAYYGIAKGAKTGTEKGTKYLKKGLGGMSKLLDEYYKDVDNCATKTKNLLSGMYTKSAEEIGKILKDLDKMNGKLTGKEKFNFTINSMVNDPFVGVAPHATGCYVKANTPQLAIIGDNKTQGEFVAPEGKLQDLLDKAVASGGNSLTNAEVVALLRDLVSNTKDIKNKDFTASISQNEVFSSVRNEARNYSRRTGQPAFS